MKDEPGKRMRRLVTIALFAAAIVSLGLLFLSVPNLELVTLTCFLAGYFLGPRDGVFAAALGEGLYSVLNPLGMAAPPMLIAQIIGMSLTAFVGSVVAVKISLHTRRAMLYLGALGFGLTVIFDLLTTMSFLIFAGLTVSKFLASLVFGMYFYLVHIALNTLIFALVLPPTIRQLAVWLHRDSGARA